MGKTLRNWLLGKVFHFLGKVDEPFYGLLNRLANAVILLCHQERVRHLGELHPDKTFYLIRHLSPTVGLGGWYDSILGYLDRAERKGWIPVLDPPLPALAESGDWHVFFKPLSPYVVDEVLKSRSVVFATRHGTIYKRYNRSEVAKRHRLGMRIEHSDGARDFLEKRLPQALEGIPSPVVGVMFRGTDYRAQGSYCPAGHAKVPPVDEFCDMVVRDLKSWGVPVGEGEHLFVVTGEQEALEQIRRRFPKCRFVDKERHANFSPGKSIAYLRLPHTTPKDNNMLYLLDIHALSRCDYLIGGINGCVLMALNLNGNRYRGVHILKTGVN